MMIRRAALIVALVATLAASGCSSGTSDSSGGGASPAADGAASGGSDATVAGGGMADAAGAGSANGDAATSGDGVGSGPGRSGKPDGVAGDGTGAPTGADGAVGRGDAATQGSCAPPDAAFECPCIGNDDCESGVCIQGPQGPQCTMTCVDSCPDGYACQAVVNIVPDVIFVCVPTGLKLCAPCQVDAQCQGGVCADIGGGKFCTRPCDQEACPTGFVCLEQDGPGSLRLCVPANGACDCTEDNAGAVRPCERSNEFGTCVGEETCDPQSGWVGCDAKEPAAEVCDGIDNDCNGVADDGLPTGESCDNTVEGVGTCTGIRVCTGPGGWVCTAPDPAPEVCDFTDNDCDGLTDEDFTTADGVYGLFDHCGTCNNSCAEGFPHATTQCDTAKSPPQCIVVACDEGYYKLNEFQCVPTSSKLCQACAKDEDCFFPDAKCIQMADGSFCGSACTSDADCPTGFACEPWGNAMQCQPLSGTCTCDGTNTDLQKSCSATWVDPNNPSAPSYTCIGVQHCTPDGWGPCIMPVDECDGQDNDCDGMTDEDFVDANGKYVSDEHCGSCGKNCKALDFAHGAGVCDATGDIPKCAVQCEPGFFDLDGSTANGCECEFKSPTDVPDTGGADVNCDGIDGELDNGIFVAKNGDDANAGTLDAPVRTIGKALELAVAQGKRDVYVATGVYQESIALVDGIGVYGGYSSDFHTRDIVLYETVLMGQPSTDALPGAVNAFGVGTTAGKLAVFDGFTVFGHDQDTPGGNSYAVYLRNCGEGLVFTHDTVFPGNGGAGLPGGAGQDGASGHDGSPGGPAHDIGKSMCTGADATGGGAGGSMACDGIDVSGGAGGKAGCPKFGAMPGPARNGSQGHYGGAQGGASGWDGQIPAAFNCSSCQVPPANHSMVGADGAPGKKGSDGLAGPGCPNPMGKVVDGHWKGGSGGNGGKGDAGGGGGGGGAGGGVEVLPTCYGPPAFYSDLGGSGGGGGSGACGGTGGKGGGPGGGSFGIFVVWDQPPTSVPIIGDNTLYRGQGGQGGNGGPGGVGGIGGNGAAGGVEGAGNDATFCAGPGGHGGRGGDGGHGGGGGGGCGGASFSLFAAGQGNWDLSPWKAPNNTFKGGGQGGAGGLGGPSLGQSGSPGADGATGDTNF